MVVIDATYDKAMKAWHFTFTYGRYEFKPVVQPLINVIKFKIPASDREYNPATKEWTVMEKHWGDIKQILSGHTIKENKAESYNYEDFFYDTSVPMPTVTKESLAEQLMRLLEVTEEQLKDSLLIKKRYRAKALELHPDRNPANADKMSELNSVWSAYNAS